MIGVIVNTVAVIAGSLIGLLFKKGIPQKLTDAVMIGIGLCTLYIGISGALRRGKRPHPHRVHRHRRDCRDGAQPRRAFEQAGDAVGRRTTKGEGTVSVATGFVTASLLFCVGAMTIVGSSTRGSREQPPAVYEVAPRLYLLYCFVRQPRVGVLFSAAFVFVFQGILVLAAQWLQPVLTTAAVAELTCAGSVIIIGLGLNLIGVTKIKVANYLPAIVAAPILSWLAPVVSSLFGRI